MSELYLQFEIDEVLSCLVENETKEDKEILNILSEKGFEDELVYYIMVFSSVYLARKLFSKVKCSEYYNVLTKSTTEKSKYIDSEIFKQVKERLDVLLSNKELDESSIMKISGRSPEFHIANDLLVKGLDINGLELTPISIILPNLSSSMK